MKRMQISLKKSLFVTVAILTAFQSAACPVCESRQPRILKGITHGAGPESNWDYLIIAVTALIVLYSLVLSVRYLVRPGEDAQDHIKKVILNP